MAAEFDPYRIWLGIPPEDQPANHYRLLGIPIFEGDMDVIENAADRQMAHVRNFQAGQHSEKSQKILNELSTAKLCLMNPETKLTYDLELESAKQPPTGQAVLLEPPVAAPPVEQAPAPPTKAVPVATLAPPPVEATSPKSDVVVATRRTSSVARARRRGSPLMIVFVLLMIVGIVAGAFLAYAVANRRSSDAMNDVNHSRRPAFFFSVSRCSASQRSNFS